MSKISTGDFQKGMFIEFRGEPHQIVDFEFYNPGKGSAVVRTKLKNLKNQKVLDFTFKSGETVEEVSVEVREMQYLYKTGDSYIFMNPVTFDQINLSIDKLHGFHKFIKEGETYQIILHDGRPLAIRYPKKVKLLVREAEEAVKGNTVSAAKKTVLVETGVKVNVPLFIKEGDMIVVDSETGEYVERISQK